ncbi:MAG: hypothetical protein ILP07_06245 [Treponema sp.]|nr:hypothetical protein [Treponema sp.]MBR6296517.1 hypothetical protein [Treponema sp.]
MPEQNDENWNEGAENEINRTRLIRIGIFSAVVVVLFGVLVLFNYISRGAWKNGLREQVNVVLGENDLKMEAGAMAVPYSYGSSSAIFAVKGQENLYAVVVRIATFFGPQAGVFTYTEGDETADFVAFANVDGQMAVSITELSKNAQIQYWKRKIPKLVSAAKWEGGTKVE